jgi:hypothetical protein
MPVRRGLDLFGSFFRYGIRGKKYYFMPNNANSRQTAYKKAAAQQKAIHANTITPNVRIGRRRAGYIMSDKDGYLIIR